MLDETYYRTTDEIIARYGKKDSALIPIMQDIQAQYLYVAFPAVSQPDIFPDRISLGSY